MATPLITAYSSPVRPGQQVIVTGSNFGRVVAAYLVDVPNALIYYSSHRVDTGTSVHVDIPAALPTGTYAVVLQTLDNVLSTSTAGSFEVSNDAPVAVPPYVSTLDEIRTRARLEYGDNGYPFSSQVTGDGVQRRFSIPDDVIEAASMIVVIDPADVAAPTVTLVLGLGYAVDERHGVITTTDPVPDGDVLVASGTAYQFLLDAELDAFISSAVLKHTHNVEIVTPYYDSYGFHQYPEVAQSVTSLRPVEVHPVALLAAIEVLWTLYADAIYDIDVVTAEGTSLPRSQRKAAIRELIVDLQQRYDHYAAMLNVGLDRIEMFTLRRTSRTTNRLVPVYKGREYDDTARPMRIYPDIDDDPTGAGSKGRTSYTGYGYGGF